MQIDAAFFINLKRLKSKSDKFIEGMSVLNNQLDSGIPYTQSENGCSVMEGVTLLT